MAATDVNVMTREQAHQLAEQIAAAGVPVFPIAISFDEKKYDGAGGLDKRPLTKRGEDDGGYKAASCDPTSSASCSVSRPTGCMTAKCSALVGCRHGQGSSSSMSTT